MFRPAALTALALVLVACGGPGKDKTADTSGDGPTLLTPSSSQSGTAATPASVSTAPLPSADPALVAFYKRLHAAPELSFEESKTSAILAAELESLGFEVTTGVGQDWVVEKSMKDNGEVLEGVGGYGVVGVFRNGNGPTVLIRTDMDGLPVPEQTGFPFASTVEAKTWTGVESNVMHACGHDVHMTSWVGTARELIARKNKWKGTLVMIAQPAEEIGLGAEAMLADGLFTRFPKPDYNLALHVSAGAPAGTINYSKGFALANVDSVDIKVKGFGGHGAYPHTTKDPILVASHIVVALQSLVSRNTDPQDSAVVTVGSFKAGAKHNIIPDDAMLLITVRSYDDKTRQMLLDGITRIAKAEAMAFGAPEPDVSIESDYTPATYNDPDTTARTMKAIGKSIGAANVKEMKPVMGGEDFSSQYSRTEEKIPSVIFWVGAVEPEKYAAAQNGGPSLPSLHSSGFAPDYDPTIATGVEAMTAAAMELFKD
ncbi:amidohydrolase [Hyphomonas sp.]|uniref:M20 metallopeptidase family protein n=1 Tax=Hyphomonas sp. TaxID=87 RepID=UPI0030F73B7B